MDNQQKTEKLAWLAGMIEGDGYISVCCYKQKNARFGYYVNPVIGVTNMDATIIREVSQIWESLGVGGFIQEKMTPMGKTLLVISTGKMANVLKVIDAILPYLIGDKKARAELTKKFIVQRMKKRNFTYDKEDLEVLKELNDRFIRVSNKGKETSINRLLNELTLPRPNKGRMISSGLTGDSKNTAEMTVSVSN